MGTMKLSETIDGINYTFESLAIRREVDLDKVVEIVKRNSNTFVDYFSTYHFSFHFRKFLAEGEDLNDIFFSVDKDKRIISFNTVMLNASDLLYHYISFAIIHTCDSFFLRKSFADHYVFRAAMMEAFCSFIDAATLTVEKMCAAFKLFDWLCTSFFLKLINCFLEFVFLFLFLFNYSSVNALNAYDIKSAYLSLYFFLYRKNFKYLWITE